MSAPEWERAPAPGKWTPSQIAEHLRLTYTVMRTELDGGEGFRLRANWWRRTLYRLVFLPRILRTGRFPRGAPAVREIRPGDGPYPQREVLGALRAEGERFLARFAELQADQARTVKHPFFGRLGLIQGLQFSTQHLRHHREQLP